MVVGAAENADSAGMRLSRARARLGLTVEEVADQLKLDPHTIVALEAGDHRAIGATVFVRGFLRRYAALVGEAPSSSQTFPRPACIALRPRATGRRSGPGRQRWPHWRLSPRAPPGGRCARGLHPSRRRM